MSIVTPAIALSIATAFALSGCIGSADVEDYTPVVRDITVWVEEMDWTVHPNVVTKIWAFCAEGDGVEPVHGNDPCGVPGPTIHVVKGDTIRLLFKNTHSIPHTIHFHGWHPFASDMNGASLIAGAMIVQPGAEAMITWVAEPAGSFIYHCHFQTPTHMEMGMYGAFIVDDPTERDRPVRDFVVVLDEWAIREDPEFVGNVPSYNFFSINGKSFPLTQAWIVRPGDKVRLHIVNAGFEFHAMHLHGYTPDAYEGVAGPAHAVPTDVREVAPGQTVVMDFVASREGVWLFHDHVVPRVTAASDGSGFGAYPRGMLTVLVVGDAYEDALARILPDLLAAAGRDVTDPDAEHTRHGHDEPVDEAPVATILMKDFAYDKPETRIAAGTTVKWTNKDGTSHTVTSEDGSFDSGEIPGRESWSYTFDVPGTFAYYCVPHASVRDGERIGMVATIVVE